jgi:hypothetical protein
VDDLNLTLASGAANGTAANGAGITIDGASATLTYNSTGDNWAFNKNLDVTGNIGVSGTVDGVDIAARDAVLTSTTTTAGAALPKAGGTMTGTLTIAGGSSGADLYINNTSPTLGFTDSNSFSDASDMYIVRAGSTGDLQFQFFDDSANTTTTTFQIDETGNATFAGTISSGAIASTGNVDVAGNITVGNNNTIFAENNIRFKATGASYIDIQAIDQDLIFRTSETTALDTNALTLDGSAGGAATFSSTISSGAISATGSANAVSAAHLPALLASGSYGGGIATRDTQESGWYQQTNGADWHFYHNRTIASDTPDSKKVLSFNSTGAATFSSTITATSADLRNNSSGAETTALSLRNYTAGANTATALNFYPTQSTNRFASIVAENLDGNNNIALSFLTSAGDTPSAALTLDQNRAATFSNNVYVGGDLFVPNLIYHTGDLDTYMQFHQTDGWRVVTGGAERFHIEGNQVVVNHDGHDADFRVESDGNANMLFVDGGNNRVAVGSTGVTGSHFTVAASTNATIVLDGDSYSTWVQDAQWNSLLLGGAYYDSGVKFAVTNRGASQMNIGHDGNATPSLQGFIFSSAPAGGSAGTTPPFENLASITRAGTVFNEDGLDRDFRVESNDQSHMFFVDALANRATFGQAVASISSGGMYMDLSNDSQAHMGICVSENANNVAGLYINRHTHDGKMIIFRRNNVQRGSIDVTTVGTTYNTTSDRRLKDNIETITNGTEKLMSMNPVTHGWKADPEADTVHGFIAQEMMDIVPEAVSGDPEGEDMMSMDYGRITPVIVAALQDALKEIKELKTRINELENK